MQPASSPPSVRPHVAPSMPAPACIVCREVRLLKVHHQESGRLPQPLHIRHECEASGAVWYPGHRFYDDAIKHAYSGHGNSFIDEGGNPQA